MDDINRLKQEEQQAFTAEQVTQLKVEEIETIDVDEQPVRRSGGFCSSVPKWMVFLGVGFFAVMFFSGGLGATIGALWPLFLLLPAYSNLRSALNDRNNGAVSGHTRRMLTRGVLALIFMALFLTNSWGMLWPLLLIGIGLSWLIFQRWQMAQSAKMQIG